MSEAASPEQDVVVVTDSDAVRTIRINRPEAMNALDIPTKTALRDALRTAATDPAVRCVLLTGTGPRAFCVGQDLREHAALMRAGDPRLSTTVEEHYNPIALALATMPKPVVVAVNGVAAGAGLSLTLPCDIRLFAASASFTTAFTAIGLSADTGASWWLPRVVGLTAAKDLLLRPRSLPADQALELGLATEVVPDDELAARAAQVAAELAAGPTVAYAAVRNAVVHAATDDLAGSLANEARLMAETFATADHAGAFAAFLAKQRYTFEGR